MPTIEKISRENIELRDAVKRRTAELTIRTKTDHGIVIIEVEDNGPGIPDEIKDKILQPFFTTKPIGQGMGLGLSLSYDIVKAHGGEMSVRAPLKKVDTLTAGAAVQTGSMFMIQLPIRIPCTKPFFAKQI